MVNYVWFQPITSGEIFNSGRKLSCYYFNRLDETAQSFFIQQQLVWTVQSKKTR